MENQNEKIDESKTNLQQNTQNGFTNGQSTTNGVTETNNSNNTSDAGSNGLPRPRRTGDRLIKATDSQSSSLNNHTEVQLKDLKRKMTEGRKEPRKLMVKRIVSRNILMELKFH